MTKAWSTAGPCPVMQSTFLAMTVWLDVVNVLVFSTLVAIVQRVVDAFVPHAQIHILQVTCGALKS